MFTLLRENKIAPQWFSDELKRIGGTNPFGGPNFDCVWSESATIIRDGKVMLQCPGPPCWVLREWEPPEAYGTPETWELEQTGEPFPQFGKYEIRQPFRYSGIVNGVLVHECMELCSTILDLVVPIILQSKDASYEKRRLALDAIREREEKEKQDRIEARLADASPQFKDACSFRLQVNRNSVVQQKMWQIQQNWQRAMAMYKAHQKGASVHNPN